MYTSSSYSHEQGRCHAQFCPSAHWTEPAESNSLCPSCPRCPGEEPTLTLRVPHRRMLWAPLLLQTVLSWQFAGKVGGQAWLQKVSWQEVGSGCMSWPLPVMLSHYCSTSMWTTLATCSHFYEMSFSVVSSLPWWTETPWICEPKMSLSLLKLILSGIWSITNT